MVFRAFTAILGYKYFKISVEIREDTENYITILRYLYPKIAVKARNITQNGV